MTPETLKRLEELYDKWCNDPSSPDRDVEIPARVMDHLPDLIAAVKERDAWRAEFPEREPKHVSYELAVVSAELKAAQADHGAAQKVVVEALKRIYNFPVHSEPVGGAYNMQDIAYEALAHAERITGGQQ